MRYLQVIFSILILSGCAKNSGVIPYGDGYYMVSRQAATGFQGMGTLKAEALKEANLHCSSLNKVILVVKEIDAKPPYVLGNYPRTEIHFKCTDFNH